MCILQQQFDENPIVRCSTIKGRAEKKRRKLATERVEEKRRKPATGRVEKKRRKPATERVKEKRQKPAAEQSSHSIPTNAFLLPRPSNGHHADVFSVCTSLSGKRILVTVDGAHAVCGRKACHR